MIRFKQLSLFQGSQPLLIDVNQTLYPEQKIGVVGKNGCGKSSLFSMLRNELATETGNLELPARWLVASAKQETPASALNALDYVLSGHLEYHSIQQALIAAEITENGIAIAEQHARLDAINGWSLPALAAKMLTGLSFTEQQMKTAVSELSGGWRMRLNLAQALIQPAELLLLDEPTNHLDLEAVLWLESYLKHYQGMLLCISHDRNFLDSFCSHILHFDNQKLNYYTGNYSQFEKQKHAKQVLQQAEFDKQQKEIAHLESFINRFKAKASKATQAQSRVKALNKMDKVNAVQIRLKFSFKFFPINKNITELIDLDKLQAGYDKKIVLQKVSMRIMAGQRIGLLGRNGEGKSTLIKIICGELKKQAGELKQSKHFYPGYFAQHQVEQLNVDQSALWHIQSLENDISEQAARNFLGGFAFHGDKTLHKVRGFSGGEKARLVLAMITWKKPNLLLLDEPTNHFDIEMREALALALQDYEGAVILVAHDKNLLESVVDEFWLVNQGMVQPFKGDLSDYQKWLKDHRWGTDKTVNEETFISNNPSFKLNNSSNNNQEPGLSRKEKKRIEAEIRQQKSPVLNRLKKIDHEMILLQKEKKQIENRLADSDIYFDDNKEQLSKLMNSSQQVTKDLQQLEDEWLDLNEKLEDLTSI